MKNKAVSKQSTITYNKQPAQSKKMVINKWLVISIVSIIIFFIQGPLTLLVPEGGLDPSWRLGLRWAELKGLSFGNDIAFTYGPLHFLSHGLMNIGTTASLRYEALLYIIAHFGIIFLITTQLINLLYRQPWKFYSVIEKLLIVGGLLMLVFIRLKIAEVILVISCILFIRLIFYEKSKKRCVLNILLNTMLLSVVCMIKFSYTLAALTLIAIAFIGVFYQKKSILGVYTLLAFMIFNVIFWLLCGQSLSALPNYYLHGIEISSGYTEAMLLSYNNKYELTYGVYSAFLLCFIGGLSLWFFFAKKSFYHAFVLFITLPLLFVAFKNGFVRADIEHAMDFYYQFSIIIIFLIFFIVGDKVFSQKQILPILLLIIMVSTAVIMGKYSNTNVEKKEKYPLQRIFTSQTILANKYQNDIKAEYPPISNYFLEQTKDKTIDIFPWDIALLYAYDLNWSPRPVIQSYSAYTSNLDYLNAKHFEGEKAPDNIIYTYAGLDGRNPLFDEPAVFRNLLENYDLMPSENYIYLKRKQEIVKPVYTSIDSNICSIGAIINVPQIQGHHIYCNIDISLNFFGKLMNTLYKTEPIYIYLYLKGNPTPVPHRFIRRVGTDGLLISKYAGNLYDVFQIFTGEYEQNIEKIQIIINSRLYYKSEMKYVFYTAPFNKNIPK